MSLEVFKQNMLTYMRNQKGIGSYGDFAKKLTQEYDAACKRGFDTVNGIVVSKGNTELMETILNSVHANALQQSGGEHPIITNMGKAFVGYWTGAQMSLSPPPIIPSIGSILNVTQVSNTIIDPGVWQPTDKLITPEEEQLQPIVKLYDKLDWSKIPLDKNSPEVQEIINPNINKINQKINENGAVDDLGKAAVTQTNNQIAEIIDKALYEQGIIQFSENPDDIKSGYRNLDELLKIAGNWAPKLGKNPRVKYENLRSGYKAGIHGLCPQGTQSVVVALTGVSGLGRISGNADWFSFKNPSTGGGRSSFANNIGGKTYYNDKVRVGSDFISTSSQWQVGDIIVMGYTGGKPYGHIQVWTGWKWVSDFTQNKVQTNNVDFNTIALWRLNENGKQAVQSQKTKS